MWPRHSYRCLGAEKFENPQNGDVRRFQENQRHTGEVLGEIPCFMPSY